MTTSKKNKKWKTTSKKWKTNKSTKINLIGCDTIVNSPSCDNSGYDVCKTVHQLVLTTILDFYFIPGLRSTQGKTEERQGDSH